MTFFSVNFLIQSTALIQDNMEACAILNNDTVDSIAHLLQVGFNLTLANSVQQWLHAIHLRVLNDMEHTNCEYCAEGRRISLVF